MTGNTGEVRVWDPFIRVFHWSLVVLFTVAYLTGEESDALHEWSGYAILVLVGARIVWGLVGSRHARFSDFLRGPSVAFGYLKGLVTGNARNYLGHNPAAGWMVIALLLSVLITAGSGVVVLGLEGDGPLAGRIDAHSWLVTSVASVGGGEDEEHERGGYEADEVGETYAAEAPDGEGAESGEEAWEEIHEFFANFTIFLIVLHLLGVLASSIAHRENLVRAMFTGRKRAV